MNRSAIIAGAAIVLLALSVIALPRAKQAETQSSPPTDGHNLVQNSEKPRTNDGETFKPDWN
jgi:cell division septation protein DedD